MALNDYENSQERGEPVELYHFVYGDGAGSFYAYTNAEQAITSGGVTYQPLPINRDKIKTKGRADGREITVELPLFAQLAELFRVFPPARVVTLTIRQGHVGPVYDLTDFLADREFKVIWVGRVLESRRNGDKATLTCESSAAGMQRVGLRLHYQWPCPLALYGSRCGADKTAAKFTTTATVSGNQVTLPLGWSGTALAADFVGGLAEWDTADGREFRTILSAVSDTVLSLNAVPSGYVDGDPIDIYLGCPHTLDGCGALHNNFVNYGGQPFIPLTNPVGKNNHT